jgi:hypothetical protein
MRCEEITNYTLSRTLYTLGYFAIAHKLYEPILRYVQYVGHIYHSVLCKTQDSNELVV